MANWITKINGSDNKNTSASGFVANRQAAESAVAVGFKEINYFTYALREASDEEIGIRVTTLLSGVKPKDVVIVQWPMWQSDNRFEQIFIQKLRLIPEVKIAAMVWDVMSWVKDDRERDYTGDYSLRSLNDFDLVIAANRKMAGRMRNEGGVKSPILSMDLSDSLYKGPLREKKVMKKLYFIGSRINQNMVLNYTAQTPFDMIGNASGLDKKNDAITFLGTMPSDDVPFRFDGGFGVVQYAKPVNFKGMQKYGEYNNPLKLSQYLAAGIPVVIGSQMAHAELVKSKNLGIVLDDLNDIDKVLAEMTLEEYQAKLEAVKPWSQAIRTGYFAKRACLEAVRVLKLGKTDSLAEKAVETTVEGKL
ncbi:beta-1,6-galactofuranosyltransferase [Lactococcus hodotermopsidis]|uniref:Beta-1,6-galactofuranosyltransferase n=1 Tax=Pseudolactococcus hodotermopsidis TaxID=2709157 RepID=A0A6A0BEY0_9LACT|nr:beta-1,6-galactofuranosyltransferase [Lactococcus hodotermopsidis]GFH43004.1 beta-1,6-galactofuranosyltransferase [Lactococcus hodotermopsidis]